MADSIHVIDTLRHYKRANMRFPRSFCEWEAISLVHDIVKASACLALFVSDRT